MQTTRSGDVITERGKDHVVDGLGRDVIQTRPARLRQVRILDAPAHAALRPVVDFVPEPDRCFADGTNIARAGAAGTRRKRSGWRDLGRATGVIGERRTVAA